MEQRKPAIVGRNLSRSFQLGETLVPALHDVSLEMYPGELVLLLGPSGSGKTTLLHTLSGLEKPDEGEVWLDGDSLYSLSDFKLSRLRSHSFGFIFQSYNLLSTLTASENVQIPLRLIGVKQPAIQAAEMLTRVGLGERLHHKPGQLSGGEQQRVAVARALVARPKIVFADEPTGNLDSQTGHEIMALLRELVTEHQAACLMVTHNHEMMVLADRTLHMRDGRLLLAEITEEAKP